LLTDYLSSIDAAVHLLGHTAQATDTLLHQQAPLPDSAKAAPRRRR
jgi:hypothetical protein